MTLNSGDWRIKRNVKSKLREIERINSSLSSSITKKHAARPS